MPSESSPYDRMKTGSVWPGVIEAYREHLPVTDDTRVVTLLEGNTPLIPSVALPKRLGVDVNVLFKFEGDKIYEERWFVDTEQWKGAF